MPDEMVRLGGNLDETLGEVRVLFIYDYDPEGAPFAPVYHAMRAAGLDIGMTSLSWPGDRTRSLPTECQGHTTPTGPDWFHRSAVDPRAVRSRP